MASIQNSASDECGYRQYPAGGPIRVAPDSAEWNAEADVAEALLNAHFEQDFSFMPKAPFS